MPAAVLGGGDLNQKRRKSEPKEEEKRADKNLTFSRPLCLWLELLCSYQMTDNNCYVFFFKNKTQHQ